MAVPPTGTKRVVTVRTRTRRADGWKVCRYTYVEWDGTRYRYHTGNVLLAPDYSYIGAFMDHLEGLE